LQQEINPRCKRFLNNSHKNNIVGILLAAPTEKWPAGRPSTRWRDYISGPAWSLLRPGPGPAWSLLGVVPAEVPELGCSFRDPPQRKNGCENEWMNDATSTEYHEFKYVLTNLKAHM